ncbi:LOW QUALITY PROTEIN: uncharacterized protein LOC6562754 [Drosophila grimshawi]|uniref:LOW QUALITY PROTEIN: uncharacterized protein LOC6562754 n=1 Tax=Drosophila grimshawi TaxID=7222 RepID=UPI001C936082|nr:LOW QUALITY PROTEIN: uncharacterized protein LOC6562754 [Drosophila grimshawi]
MNWKLNSAISAKLGRCIQQLGSRCGRICPTRQKNGANRCLNNATRKIDWQRRYGLDTANKFRCDCTESSLKLRWHRTNRNIIMALARVLDIQADIVSDFLYTLSLQNFGQVLRPQGRQQLSSRCRVPLSDLDICDTYCSIFDGSGNLRNPYHPESLLQLLTILQSVLKAGKELKESANAAHGKLFGQQNTQSRGERLAHRAGIGEDSLARQNGRRRRYRLYANYRLDGFDTLFDVKKNFAAPFAPNSEDLGYSRNPFIANKRSNALAQDLGAADANLWLSKYPKELSHVDKFNNRFYGNYAAYSKSLGDVGQGRRSGIHLRHLIRNVNTKVGIGRDPSDLANAMRKLDLNEVQVNEANAKAMPDADRGMSPGVRSHMQPPGKKWKMNSHLYHGARTISHQYHETATGRRVSPGMKNHLDLSANKSHLYYGAQVPILAHEPFNRSKPWTWIRRHPRPLRMTQSGDVVSHTPIHRYRRASVEQQLDAARKRSSVRTIYSDRDGSAVSSNKPNLITNPHQPVQAKYKIDEAHTRFRWPN